MAVFSSAALGFRIQLTRFWGLLGRTPAMYIRSPTPVSGGPTSPTAPLMPRMVWQEPQPYRPMAATPRFGSPPVTVAPSRRAELEHPVASAMTRISQLFRILLSPLQHGIAFPQPHRKKRQTDAGVNHAGGNPHDEPSDLLIGQRVGGIPGRPAESQEGPENAGMDRGGEDINDGGAVMHAPTRVKQRPPEQQGG